MDNKSIARVLAEIADILEIQGAIFFRVNAYRKAAITIENLPLDLRKIVETTPGELQNIPGIGKDLSEKIKELVLTGKCLYHEELKSGFPPGLLIMLGIRGLGPKKIQLFFNELKITTLEELKNAAREGKLRNLPKMGEKSEAELLKAIEEFENFSSERILINEAQMEADRIIEFMKICPDISQIQYAGSLRRCQESIGDIDILVTVKEKEKVVKIMKHYLAYGEILSILSEGDTKSSIILKSGVQVDLRVIDENSFGAALHYFTGSKEHNIRIRDLAKKKGLKVNEYGVFKDDEMIGGKSENEVFELVGLPYLVPEIRKDDGEIEYGLSHKEMPEFVKIDDIRADLHSHSNYSDGKNTISEMAEAFIRKGYEYFAVTDHSAIVGVTGGMVESDVINQSEEIDKLNLELAGRIRILKGAEVDILKDGTLDFSDEVLKKLDVVIISAHLFGRLPAEEQTKRLIRAIENPYSMILAHPTGRLINKRAEMEFDMKKVINACIENKVALEINSSPSRLDLPDKYVRGARDMGAKFVVNTDSHSIYHPYYMRFGVGIARRGWLEAGDVLNTYSIEDFFGYFR